jgi:hypothetical protein
MSPSPPDRLESQKSEVKENRGLAGTSGKDLFMGAGVRRKKGDFGG